MLVIFENDKRGSDRAPDYRIVLGDDEQQGDAATDEGGDKLPF